MNLVEIEALVDDWLEIAGSRTHPTCSALRRAALQLRRSLEELDD